MYISCLVTIAQVLLSLGYMAMCKLSQDYYYCSPFYEGSAVTKQVREAVLWMIR